MKKLIGKGTFTKAYLLENGKVELVSTDPIKECMALWGFGESDLFPSIERTDYLDSGEQVFTMEYYPKTPSLKNSLDAHNYALYSALRKLSIPYTPNKHLLAMKWIQAFESLPQQFSEEKEALIEAVDAIQNYSSDVCFEISPRNVRAVNGKLLLLDCFFLRSKLFEINSKRKAG